MSHSTLQLGDDIDVVERRGDIRIMLSLPGRYSLANKRGPAGERRQFACRVINISTKALALAAPVAGPVGERVIAHIDQFGKLEGPIFRVLDGGFVMEIVATDEERERLANKILWFEKLKNHDAHDGRRHERIIPQNPYSTVVFADGITAECLVIDVSASGTAVSSDVIPDLGTVVAVGTVVGRVVRRFADGFAVEFAEAQDPATVEARIARPR